MLIRLAIVLLLFVLSLPACKKPAAPEKTSPAADRSPVPSPSPVPSVVPTPVEKKPVIDQNAQVVIFGYHRFVNQVRRPDTEITPAAFEAQMKELQEKKIPVISLQDFLAWKRGEKAIPPRAAVITFDDGWKSQYEVAWPILKKFGYPLTMFIYTEGIRGGHFAGGESISWEQLADMRDAGVDIQAHSETHGDLRKPYDKIAKKKLNPEEYNQWLENEIGRCKRTLEEKLGIRVNCFAVPYGNINDKVREVAKKEGYEAVFTVYGQRLTIGAPNNSLGRYLIEANKPKVFSEAVNFSGATSGGAVAVEEVAPADLTTQPADGDKIKTPLPLIRANLASLGKMDTGSVQMRISGIGLVPASYDEKTQTVSYQVIRKLPDKNYTVFVTARSGGKKVETHWSFTVAENSGGAPAAADQVPTTATPPPKK